VITCREASLLHTAAEEGALTGAKKAFYALHMKICSACQCYRGQLHTTVEVLKKLPHEEPPASLVDLLASELEKKT
jgi:hypothetical protein